MKPAAARPGVARWHQGQCQHTPLSRPLSRRFAMNPAHLAPKSTWAARAAVTRSSIPNSAPP